MSIVRDTWVMLEKDLRSEWRTREILSAMGVFGALVLLIFNFAFPPGVRQSQMIALTPGILWVSFIFAGILGLNRSMAQEKEEGCLQGILLTPTDRGVLYLGKMLANLLFLFFLEVLTVVVFALFFNVGFSGVLGPFALMTVLGSVGFIAVGTLFAAIAVQTRFQEVLLPILLIPLVSPVLIGTVKSHGVILAGGDLASVSFWIKFLFTYDLIFVIVCFVGFEYVVQE